MMFYESQTQGTHTHTHTHTHTPKCSGLIRSQEEEEMWSPGRAHTLASPMVLAGPHRFGASVVGGVTPPGPAWLRIMAAAIGDFLGNRISCLNTS